MVKYGVVVGRFQLFHNDHLKYLLAAKKKCTILIVGITSPDTSFLINETIDPHRCLLQSNPFTFFQRLEMIQKSLVEAQISLNEFVIVPFPIEKPDIIKCYIPSDSKVYLTIYDEWGKEKLRRLTALGLSTEVLWQTNNKGLSASDIRNNIASGNAWENSVPMAVYEYIISNGLLSLFKPC